MLDAKGEVVERGSVATTAPELTKLVRRLRSTDELLCGQEVGTMSHFVHDVVTAAGATILSFNAHHLRMIAASRKKTDKRDADAIGGDRTYGHEATSTGASPSVVELFPSSPFLLLPQHFILHGPTNAHA